MIILRQHSKINKANTTSNSLRTGIPKAIADVLEVDTTDELTWTVNVIDNQKVVTVKKRE
jgi:hypothetical protein